VAEKESNMTATQRLEIDKWYQALRRPVLRDKKGVIPIPYEAPLKSGRRRVPTPMCLICRQHPEALAMLENHLRSHHNSTRAMEVVSHLLSRPIAEVQRHVDHCMVSKLPKRSDPGQDILLPCGWRPLDMLHHLPQDFWLGGTNPLQLAVHAPTHGPGALPASLLRKTDGFWQSPALKYEQIAKAVEWLATVLAMPADLEHA
jgi:hypothetical protein